MPTCAVVVSFNRPGAIQPVFAIPEQPIAVVASALGSMKVVDNTGKALNLGIPSMRSLTITCGSLVDRA